MTPHFHAIYAEHEALIRIDNVTNKRFPGNVTQSYRTRHPMRIVGEVEGGAGHPPEVLQTMLDSIAKLRVDGLDIVDD